MNNSDIIYGRKVLEAEADAINSLKNRLGRDFTDAVQLILLCKGRVVLTGIGKAGIVAQKISATFASTGTPSLYMHTAEAFHGDLGRVTVEDVVLIISNSGESEEIVRLIPLLKKIGAKIISITSRKTSSLGKFSDIVLETGEIREVCPLGLSPSASTTAALALGDALSMTVLKNRDFSAEDFAFYHTGGHLGVKMLKVSDVMRKGGNSPVVREEDTVKDVLMAITRARAGAASVVDRKGRLKGIFTDGDLRRFIEKEGAEVLVRNVREVMTASPKTIKYGALVTEAVKLMKDKKIDELPVVDDKGMLKGLLDVQDLLEIGLV